MAEDKITAPKPELEDDKPIVEKEVEVVDPDKVEGEQPEKEGAEVEKVEEEKVEPVPTRQSAQQHIIARQKRTIEKLRSKTEEEVDVENEVEEGDDTLTPEVQNAVDRQIQKRLSPVFGALANKADEDELSALFGTEPEAKKYEKRIRAHMEVWKNVPVRSIYQSLAFSTSQTATAKRKKVADAEAGGMRGVGSQRRGSAKTSNIPTTEEMEAMDDTAFEELQNKVRTGAYK